jgi:hypothetical protein
LVNRIKNGSENAKQRRGRERIFWHRFTLLNKFTHLTG